MNNLSAAEHAALPSVTIAGLIRDEPATTLPVFPRRILDLVSERLGSIDGYRMICECDSASFSVIYDSGNGLLVLICRECHNVLGGVRVAADA